MKLKNSMREDQIRKNLIASQIAIFEHSKFIMLLSFLKNHFLVLESALCLNHVPDQGEDFFTVLVNGEFIAEVEIDRFDSSVKPIFSIQSKTSYEKKLVSKKDKIMLLVANDIWHHQSVNRRASSS